MTPGVHHAVVAVVVRRQQKPDGLFLSGRDSMKAWLGLGSNLQQPLQQLQQAIDKIVLTDGIEVLKTSSFYRTPPWGDQHQDDFINAVVQIETSLDPLPLLRVLQLIENEMGRLRGGRRWGPRLIDIDLLLFGDLQLQSVDLEVPHPRMHERAFVLIPLSELDANLNIPGRDDIGKLLSGIDCKGVVRLPDQTRD